jgi:hypothetical protein
LGDSYKWRYPPFAYGLHVRKLVVQLQLLSRIDDAGRCLEPSPENDWLVLLRPRHAVLVSDTAAGPRALQRAEREDWQSYFPKLAELTIRLSSPLSLHLQLEQDEDEYKQALHDLPDQATIMLQPKLLKLENDMGVDISASDPMYGAIRKMVKLRV